MYRSIILLAAFLTSAFAFSASAQTSNITGTWSVVDKTADAVYKGELIITGPIGPNQYNGLLTTKMPNGSKVRQKATFDVNGSSVQIKFTVIDGPTDYEADTYNLILSERTMTGSSTDAQSDVGSLRLSKK